MNTCQSHCVSRSSLLSLLALLMAACSTGPQSCDVCTTSAILYGVVQDTSGQPLDGAHITGDALRDSCTAGAAVGATNGPSTSDAAGHYRAQLLSLHSPFHACLRVTAHAPTGSPWRDTTQSGAFIDFRADNPLGPHDSLRIDFVLPPQ